MVLKRCVIEGCSSDSRKSRKRKKMEGLPVAYFYQVTQEPNLLKKWNECLPKGHKMLKQKECICSLHFTAGDLSTHFEINVNGQIWRDERHHPKLKETAIPSIFPNSSSAIAPDEIPAANSVIQENENRSLLVSIKTESADEDALQNNENEENENRSLFVISKIETLVENALQNNGENMLDEHNVVSPLSVVEKQLSCNFMKGNVDVIQEKETQNILVRSTGESLVDSAQQNYCETILDGSNVVLLQSVIEEQFSFNFLKDNLAMIQTINSWWKTIVFDTCILLCRFTPPDYVVERKIIISEDLAVKVRLKEKECTIGNDVKLISMDDISKLIYRVEKTIICSGINKYSHCAGFLQGVFMCRKYNLCLNCIQWKKEKEKQAQSKASSKYVELIRFISL